MSYKSKKPGIWKMDCRMIDWITTHKDEIVKNGGFAYDECPKCGASYIKRLGHICFDYLNIETERHYGNFTVMK